MEQGNTYEEDLLNEELGSESETDTSITTIYGIPKKYFLLGCGAAAIILLLLVVFALKRPEKPATESLLEDTTVVTEEDATVTEPYVADESELDWLNTPTATASGDSVNPAAVTTDNPAAVPTLDNETQNMLRSLGYTADEITFIIDNNLPTDNLVADAEAAVDARNKESIDRLSDTASPEYKALLDQTYLGQPLNALPVDQTTVTEPHYETTQITLNSDYVKCPTNGMQLWLKCKVDANTYVWINPAPERFAKLPDRGNIVITIEYYAYGENTYITKAYESQTGLDTVEGN